MNVLGFSRWFRKEAARLLREDIDSAVDAIEAAVRRVDPRLGVELSEDEGKRELTITAGSQADAFALADEVVQSLGDIENWVIAALKPARGFRFTLNIGGYELVASSLMFAPGGTSEKGGRRIVVFVPSALLEAPRIREAVAIVVETGIGERASSQLGEIDLGPESDAPSGAKSIEDLQTWLEVDGNT